METRPSRPFCGALPAISCCWLLRHEGLAGANIRESEAPIEFSGEQISLVRKATCISYGQEADGVVTTARRSASAAPSDQVLGVFLKPSYTLERSHSWDTLGMRGTRSEGFTLRAKGVAGNIVATPYAKIHAQSMVPSAHLFWGAVWAGIAAAAVSRARRLSVQRRAIPTGISPRGRHI